MRIGSNPNKEISQSESLFMHQIIIPVYIPHEEGYFIDAFRILEICLNSLFNSIDSKTYITIVNDGSCAKVIKYLDKLFSEKKINELIHTQNVGKINAVFKGLSGSNIKLVTIADSDVLFLDNWQSETVNVFSKIPKAGVVGIVPQFKMYESNCGNIIFDNLFNKKLKFIPIKSINALVNFYDSIGWDKNYNQDYLKLGLGLEYDNLKCFIGSGHFVATYKRDMFEEIFTYIGGKKAAGIGEVYIDKKSLEKGYWRLTTHDNYAYHMGNVYEDWMIVPHINKVSIDFSSIDFKKNKKVSYRSYFIKNRLFVKLITIKWIVKLFLQWKKLPKEMIKNY